MRSPAPATERTSPVRASVTFRFARSSTGRMGVGSGLGSFLNRFIRTSTKSTPRMTTRVNVIIALRAGFLVGFDVDGPRAGGSGQFLGDVGRRRLVGLLALGLERGEFGIHAAVGAELREFLFQIVVRARVGQLVERLGGGFFLGHGLFEAVQLDRKSTR